MKSVAIILAILLTNWIFSAEHLSPDFPSYEIVSSKKDAKLPSDKAIFTFQINGISNGNALTQIVYSVNDEIDTVYLNNNLQIEVKVKPGKYAFEFYHSSYYKEIFIPKTAIAGSYRTLINLNFKVSKQENITVKKPVIYLYPTKPTLVKVKVKPRGKFTFTYPLYDDGWKVMANADGGLTVNDQFYNYLFWESEQEMLLADISFLDGFIVEGANSLAFLEEKLSAMGLNSKEKADFITFWGPQLIQNKRNFIHFYTNEECNRFAELAISPQPKSIFRLYMVYAPFETHKEYNLMDQQLPVFNREGFTVLEWGGYEVPEIHLLKQVD
jgi:hypothetical protein